LFIMFNWYVKKLKFTVLTTAGLFLFACSSQEYTTAKLAIQQSEWSKADEWLPKAMAVEPDNPEIPIVYAVEVHARNKNWKEMYDMFQKAISIDPNKKVEIRTVFLPVSEQVNNYTQFYWAEQFNKGVEKFKEIQSDPDNKSKHLNEAITYFTSASIINPKDSQTYITLSKCYLDLDNKDKAIGFIKTAVEKDPESFSSNFTAGKILLRCGMGSEAVIPYYQKAVQIEPSNSNALRELASMYYDTGKKEQSIKVFKDAIKNEQDKVIKADLFFNLGVIHNQMENYEEAEKAFDEAYYLNEDDFEAALGMASAYEGLGDKYFNGTDGFTKDFELAVRWYRKAEKKVKDVKSIDFENESEYQRQLELIRYKRDIADQN
jgi:tetratricopeptide (TPR) repeat protein